MELLVIQGGAAGRRIQGGALELQAVESKVELQAVESEVERWSYRPSNPRWSTGATGRRIQASSTVMKQRTCLQVGVLVALEKICYSSSTDDEVLLPILDGSGVGGGSPSMQRVAF
ncbi:hypothetical protein Dsin_027166 [Dipteronia sinensis]|uniref:Uncharacterized protein n=1 Tax=Dipteronia sinensis TaxID=43782 RepID=A0AAE0DYT2_9ROSI|nr:hypothetical protein Dsin_027166 [Dipteronia sinensis]